MRGGIFVIFFFWGLLAIPCDWILRKLFPQSTEDLALIAGVLSAIPAIILAAELLNWVSI